jgi:cold shock CspA family protein
MRKDLVAILSVLIVVAFVVSSFAAEGGKETSAKSENPCATKKNCGLEGISKVTGEFKSIDRKKGELVLTGEDGKDTTFKIKDIQAKGIKAGDKVEVTCAQKGEDCFAKKMRKLEKSRGSEL